MRSHHASCHQVRPSLCPSVLCWLLTPKSEKGRKTKIVVNFSQAGVTDVSIGQRSGGRPHCMSALGGRSFLASFVLRLVSASQSATPATSHHLSTTESTETNVASASLMTTDTTTETQLHLQSSTATLSRFLVSLGPNSSSICCGFAVQQAARLRDKYTAW